MSFTSSIRLPEFQQHLSYFSQNIIKIHYAFYRSCSLFFCSGSISTPSPSSNKGNYFTLSHMASSFLEKFNSQSFLRDWLCIKMSKKSRLTHIEPIGYTLSVILFSYIIYLKSSGSFSIKSSTKYSFPCV